MKHKSISSFTVKPNMRIIMLVCCFCLISRFSYAALIFPVNPDVTYATLISRIYTLNADMIEIPGGQLSAMVWDDYGIPSQMKMQVKDEALGVTGSLAIATRAESQPDITLAIDPTNPSIYILAVVYLNVNAQVTFSTYKVTGVGTTIITITPMTTVVLSSNAGHFPHIDMLPDYNNTVNGLPSLHRFAICFTESNTLGSANIREVHGDISAPTTLSPITTVGAAGGYFYGADIAISLDPISNREHIYLAYDNSNITLNETDLTLNYLAGPTAPPSVGPTTILYSGTSGSVLLPRIEAMGLNIPGSGMVPWVICSRINNDVYEFNPFMPGGFNCSIGVVPGIQNMCAAVCAGPGAPAGNVCNDNYNVGWWNARYGYMTQVVDAYTGAISTTYPDYYIANSTPVIFPGGASKIPIALTSCSNSGNYLFTGFWDGSTNVKYHLKPGIAGYRPLNPTGIANINNDAIKIFPNPVADKIVIQGITKGTYSIINILGQVVKIGVVNNNDYEVNVSDLFTGNYFLSVKSINGNKDFKFVKN